MSCSSPITAWQSFAKKENGKSYITFTPPSERYKSHYELINLPCGHCISCRLKKSAEWATRGYCELKTVEFGESYMITLTYDNNHLPMTPSSTFSQTGDLVPTIVKKDVQDFIKRLRRYFEYNNLVPKGHHISYMYCGEYGDKLGRPHYHLIMFGIPLTDLVKDPYTHLRMIKKGYWLYMSDTLNKLWPQGRVRAQDACWEDIAYVARYVTKKIYGDMKESHYDGATPEFFQCSLKPAIGARWLEKYIGDVYAHDEMIYRKGGKYLKTTVPKYFDKVLEKVDVNLYNEIKEQRKKKIIHHSDAELDALATKAERINNRLVRHYEVNNDNII